VHCDWGKVSVLRWALVRMCRKCTMVSVNQAFVKRLARTKGRISSGTRESTWINYITESIPVRNAVIARRTKARAHYRKAWRAGNTLLFVRKSRRVLHDRLMAQLHFKSYPQFIKQFIKAANSGLLCRDNHAFSSKQQRTSGTQERPCSLRFKKCAAY
jgi:hypothetical protein